MTYEEIGLIEEKLLQEILRMGGIHFTDNHFINVPKLTWK
ncbi:11838_t:CDS:2 [Entrophospora sp. SA101]|nr:11838_t:CDS:2 [Entrophospora sp. SA101]